MLESFGTFEFTHKNQRIMTRFVDIKQLLYSSYSRGGTIHPILIINMSFHCLMSLLIPQC